MLLVQWGPFCNTAGREMLALSGVLDVGIGERRSVMNVGKTALGHSMRKVGRVFILKCGYEEKENMQMQVFGQQVK